MSRTHNRNMSSISYRDIDQYYDEKQLWLSEEEMEPQGQKPSRQSQSQITLIYLLFLAEAIMSASLSAQIPLLITSTTACSDYNAAYLRSLLECAYFLGSTCAIFWGYASDRVGRRAVALIGLVGVSACSFSMGFSTTLPGWVAFRFLAGGVGSAVFTSALASLADISMASTESTRNVSRLPLIAVCGGVGPFLQSIVRKIGEQALTGVWQQWPALSSQITCTSLILVIAIVEMLYLGETLKQQSSGKESSDLESEKLTLLRGDSDEESGNLALIAVVDIDEEVPNVGMGSFLRAPSFLTLLASFSILSLHSSTFEVLLPHLGDTPASLGGMGLPCGLLDMLITAVKAVAAIQVVYLFPKYADKIDVLRLYRRMSTVFPVIYLLIPVCAFLATVSGAPPTSWAVFSTLAVMGKEMLAEAAQVLVIVLAFAAAPSASSAGTGIGLLGLSNLFKALAVGVSGLCYYFSDAYSVVVINATLWVLLAVMACVGAMINYRLRKPLVGQDYPEMLQWKNVFDAEDDVEAMA